MTRFLPVLLLAACAAPVELDAVEVIEPALILSPAPGLEDETELVALMWSLALEPHLGPGMVGIRPGGITVYALPPEQVWLKEQEITGERTRFVNGFQQWWRIVLRDDIESFACRTRVLAHEVGHALGAEHSADGLMYEKGPIAPESACGWEIDDLALETMGLAR